MRRFDFVSGSAAKFWEVDRAGGTVTVRYGRIGAQGRTQDKEFDTPAEAAAHAERLIAEKLRKGYVESTTGAPTPDVAGAVPAVDGGPAATDGTDGAAAAAARPTTAAPASQPAPATPPAGAHPAVEELPDEETFVVPAGWRRQLVARRGGPAGSALPSAAKGRAAGQKVLEPLTAELAKVVAQAADPELAAALRAYLAGAPNPLGGAALLVAAGMIIGWQIRDHQAYALADLLVADLGPVGAAIAMTEQATVTLGAVHRGIDNLRRNVVDQPAWGYRSVRLDALRRVRGHLAAATDEQYAAARDALAPYRSGPLPARVVTSFLLPTERDWVAEDLAAVCAGPDRILGGLLLGSVDDPARFTTLAGRLDVYSIMWDPAFVITGVATVGPAVAPLLAEWFDHEHTGAESQQRLVSMLAALPTDEAMELLLARLDRKYVQAGVLEALGRFPVRGVRLLARAAGERTAAGKQAGTLLRGHVLTHPAAVEAALPDLDPADRERVERITGADAAVPVAGPGRLPPVLVAPPWLARRRPVAPPVVTGLTRPEGTTLAWLTGERERWAAIEPSWSGYSRDDLTVVAREVAAGRANDYQGVHFFTRAPEEMARPLLPAWRPEAPWHAEEWMCRLLGRYEADAVPAALHLARAARGTAQVLLPVADGAVADLMADWLDRLKSGRSTAVAWFRRHPGHAARALLPAAVGAPGPQRRAAERALRLIAGEHRDLVLAAAREYGEAALAAATQVLDADPLAQLPARIPALPQWFDPVLLPPVLLRDRSAALPADALRHLGTMFALSKLDEVYPGVELVRAAVDPLSLAEFAWALFERWQAAGAPSKESWAFTALGLVGDDDTARRLAPLIRAWPGEGGHARAVTGLDVLAAIGTDVALMHLYGISQKVKFRGLRERAGQKVTEVADGLGLDTDQLGDRLVPDLGLDADGSLVLDYGPRRFTVGFDEQLKPYVVDAAGARRKDLPKPGARDDQALAPVAYQRFVGLKKDVRTLAADQIRRFEAAMVAGRRWPATDFQRYFLSHPLLWHVVRRLVWATVDADGAVLGTFRVAEDRTLADVDDETYVLPDDAVVTIAHPVGLGAAGAAWAEVFADYEILQPFPQLGREVHRLTEAERDERLLHRHMGIEVPAGRLLSLERRGWRRGTPQDAGIQGWLERELPGGRAVVIDLDPGIAVGEVGFFPDQKLDAIWVNDRPEGGWHGRDGKVRFGELDEVTASELLRDLAEVTR
ncbi:DUF4132 domain-containing protein [Micromonospora auratinigra]|uniref:WGR domain-containing protein, predicted DNA-binding domain in MolR n=1 Tax=Micromonospora auratinigra TaxID=261654 RepID=A0A1A8Z7K3_9ACTN|nr:DUF4132 domain-containing protein [Micromonospora auratinigra]SBT39768.1 WGR domain-containing protein, predicted DNA-binding domain in MolR [Micromonospora auratinigra]